MTKSFNQDVLSTIGCGKINIKATTTGGIEKRITLWDTSCWGGRFDSVVQNYLVDIDAVLLLFDLFLKNPLYSFIGSSSLSNFALLLIASF